MSARTNVGDAAAARRSAAAQSRQANAGAGLIAATEGLVTEALLRAGLARDFELLAVLNDAEPTRELLQSLRSAPANHWFAFNAGSDLAVGARELLDAALDAMPDPVCQATLDDLAADFAGIYLIHSYRAPPTESPWLDKDQLERQEPMFELAAWYRRFGLAAQDRQRRSDDHLVLQLQFLSHLFSKPGLDLAASADEAARFMDQHLLRWIGAFAERVAARCETPYYCGLTTLTHGYLESVREYLAHTCGQQRPTRDEAQVVAGAPALGSDAAPQSDAEDEEMAARYLPGVAPSW